MDGKTLKEKIKKSKVPLATLAYRINTYPQSLTTLFKGKDVKSGIIEKIADALELPLSYFYENFNREKNYCKSSDLNIEDIKNNLSNFERIKNLSLEIEHLKEILEQKDILIEEKSRLINLYSQIFNYKSEKF